MARFVSINDLDATLALCPEGFRVGVNKSYNMFGQETVPVEWEADTPDIPTEAEQHAAIEAVDALLAEAGIAVYQAANGITVPKLP